MPESARQSGYTEPERKAEPLEDAHAADQDLIMEAILENIHSTPIGQVLEKIAGLPELRREKVLGVRRQITEGSYDINERLTVALDKVLEDLTT